MQRLALFALAALAPAQQFVAELDPAPASASSTLAGLAIADGSHVWFQASSADAGSELWRSDGTVAGTRMVVDFAPGPGGSHAQPLIAVGGRALVLAAGWLWATDGTAAGTVRLTNGLASVRVLGNVNGRVLLADTPVASPRVWSTDFTAAGTRMIGAIEGIVATTVHGNELLLLATIGGEDHLYATDGSYFVDRLAIGGRAESGFGRLGAHEYFVASNQVHAFLCRTDGTAAGSTALTPIVTAPPPPRGVPDTFAEFGGLLVFSCRGQLFRSDGTVAGTLPIAAPVTGAWQVTAVGARAFFVGSTPATGAELWQTDGTAAGTAMVLDLEPGPGGSRIAQMIDVQGRLFAWVEAPPLGSALLLSSDGTAAGTQTLAVTSPQSTFSLVPFGSECAATFSLPTGGPARIELYAVDAALATRRLTSGQTRPGVTWSGPAAALGETLYFLAGEAVHGRELWRSDGTAAGTALVQDLAPGPESSIGGLVGFDGALFFASGGALHRSDGTAAGTAVAVQPSAGQLFGLVQAGDYMLFLTYDGLSTRLWRSDGTPTGTVQIASVNQGFHAYRQVGALTYFAASDSFQLVFARSDGTPGGTVVLVAGQLCAMLGTSAGRVVFGRIAGSAMDVMVTDGTVAGTQLVGHLEALPETSATLGNTVVFVANGQAHATDGVSLVSPLPVPRIAAGASPVAGLDAIYLLTDDPGSGRALYRTDGTVAGTALAASLGQNFLVGVFAAQPIAAGNRLFLGGSNGGSGVEPWISDGTPAGTTLLADVNPNGNSNPLLLGVAGHRAFLLADDGTRGRELWSVDLGSVGAASMQPFARGCPGTAGVPRLATDGAPLVGNAGFALALDRGAASALMVWIGGFGIGGFSIGGGCEILPANIALTLWTFTDAAGRARLPLPVPVNQALVGLQLTMQGSVLDPLGASAYGSTVTPGMILVVGR